MRQRKAKRRQHAYLSPFYITNTNLTQITLMTAEIFPKVIKAPHCGDKAFRAVKDTICLHKAGTYY